MIELRELFAEMLRNDASDLHLVVGAPPQIRVRGDLQSIPGMEILTGDDTRELIFGVLTNEQRQRLEVSWELDFSYSVPGMARWRVNAFFQRGSIGAAFRVIPEKIRPLSELNVPDALYQLCDLPRGLVLVTGPTGSGKSTTLAAMIDVINEQRHDHILTVEDPIEFIHQHKNCVVNQREVGSDTDGFARALKSALRQDPDIILVGEMRDLETIQTALTAAETGHLVFGTLHTNSAAKTVDRVIDVFPPHQQGQIRVQLATSLQGVVTQTLVPTTDGRGRVVACEVLIPNPAIRNLIREGKVYQIPSVMQTSQGEGMQTLDAALATLVRTGRIDRQEAFRRCAEESELERLLASGAGAPESGQMVYRKPPRVRLQTGNGLSTGIDQAILANPAAGAPTVARPDVHGVPDPAAIPMYQEAVPNIPAMAPIDPSLMQGPPPGAPLQFAPAPDGMPPVLPPDMATMHGNPTLISPVQPSPTGGQSIPVSPPPVFPAPGHGAPVAAPPAVPGMAAPAPIPAAVQTFPHGAPPAAGGYAPEYGDGTFGIPGSPGA